jgi:hypothetical protein
LVEAARCTRFRALILGDWTTLGGVNDECCNAELAWLARSEYYLNVLTAANLVARTVLQVVRKDLTDWTREGDTYIKRRTDGMYPSETGDKRQNRYLDAHDDCECTRGTRLDDVWNGGSGSSWMFGKERLLISDLRK